MSTSLAAKNTHKNTSFDFGNVAGLGAFWDGTKSLYGGTSKPGGGQFDQYKDYDSGNPNKRNVSHNVDLLFQNLVGRNADPSGGKYWKDRITSGADTYESLIGSLKASGEYTGQQSELANNPNATATDLKNLGSAYVSPFHPLSGSAAAGWEPGDAITQAIAEAGATTDAEGNPKASYSDAYKTVGEAKDALFSNINFGGGGSSTTTPEYIQYDDSALRALIASLSGELGGLRTAFDEYKGDMNNMWANANWGSGTNQQQSTVQGVKTQNELPGWSPKTGGTAGFFGRGNRFGLTTGSLNI